HSTQKEDRFDVNYFVLDRRREEIHKRIEERVDRMISNGLLEEVKGILHMGYSKKLKPFQSLGYLQMIRYMDGEIGFDDAVREIKKETKRYAKRQITWFRAVKDAQWINIVDREDPEDVAEKIFRYLQFSNVDLKE
ncbi:MAG: tRNA (adenosine(37)-N6)-dimethylallyltransferase MiaA, partial [Nitrospinae bacterium]|nr:tRNA (adenosine(37)-N6)-dimethylallyltransferase MiaA [Nitrospinota bacterium]